MALGVVNVDHELETMGDVDVVRINVLPALLERLGQLQSCLEDVFLVFHDRVVGALVSERDTGVFGKLHFCFCNIRLIDLASVTTLVGYLGRLYPLGHGLYQPHFDLAELYTLSDRRQFNIGNDGCTENDGIGGNRNAVAELVCPDIGVGLFKVESACLLQRSNGRYIPLSELFPSARNPEFAQCGYAG
jgi:hypothetical protein